MELVEEQGQMTYESVLLDVANDATLPDVSTLRSFKLSMYSVAQDPSEKYAIRILDIETLNPIAPTTLVSNYTGGVWTTIEYHNSIRLRIMEFYGVHISAVAFCCSGKDVASESILEQ